MYYPLPRIGCTIVSVEPGKHEAQALQMQSPVGGSRSSDERLDKRDEFDVAVPEPVGVTGGTLFSNIQLELRKVAAALLIVYRLFMVEILNIDS